jgi:hypothetical protein
LFGASASSKAAQEQEAAEQKGINLLQGDQTTGEANYQPYLTAGSTATGTLASLLGTPGSGLLTPWTQQFTLPTAAQAAATPGYQFQLQEGEQAAQNSAAGQGSLLSGRTLASLNNYAQGAASTNYQNTVGNELTQYQSAYNTFLNNQNNAYARLMGLSSQGLQAAGGAGSLLANLGGDTATLLSGQGAAAAAGTVGSANAISGGLTGAGNALSGDLTLSALLGNGGMSGPYGNITGTPVSGGSLPPGYSGTPTAPYSPFNLPPGSSGVAPTLPGYAAGTDFAPGGPSIVGEGGPEVVNLPRGSQVIPNGAPPRAIDPGFGTGPQAPGSPIARPIGAPPYQPQPLPIGGPARPVSGSPFNNPAYPSPYPVWGGGGMMPMRALA